MLVFVMVARELRGALKALLKNVFIQPEVAPKKRTVKPAKDCGKPVICKG
jgi:hypothetical protein